MPIEATTLNSLIDDWNTALEHTTAVITQHNEEVERKYKSGELLPESFLNAYLPVPKKVDYPSLSWVRWWKASWGWTLLARTDNGGGWLPFNSSDMQQAREEVRALITRDSVNKHLILNYDQVWRCAFSLTKCPLMYKHRSGAGQRAAKRRMGPQHDKKIHTIRGSRKSITAPWLNLMSLCN